MLGALFSDRPEPAGASTDRPAKPCRTARADSFGTRVGPRSRWSGCGGDDVAQPLARPSFRG